MSVAIAIAVSVYLTLPGYMTVTSTAVSGHMTGLDAMDMTVVHTVHMRWSVITTVVMLSKAAHKKGDYDKTPAKHSGGQVNL
jgi:hypothetical protein